MPFALYILVVYSCALYLPIVGCHEGYKYCTLEHKMFYPLSLPSGAWSTATIEVATSAGNAT